MDVGGWIRARRGFEAKQVNIPRSSWDIPVKVCNSVSISLFQALILRSAVIKCQIHVKVTLVKQTDFTFFIAYVLLERGIYWR